VKRRRALLGSNPTQIDTLVSEIMDTPTSFVVLVERTFSWFGRNRRLAKDFDNLAETLGAFVALASIRLALRLLAGAKIANPANHRLASHDGEGLQIGW
jgi:hypothetical protein